jgi:DNA modification methylase
VIDAVPRQGSAREATSLIDIRLGDCVERMRELPPDSIDLVLTSPPYDNLRRYGSGSAFDFEALAVEIERTLKPGGVLVWVVGDQTINGSETGTSFRQTLHFQSIGLRRHDTMIYGKSNPHPKNHLRYEQAFEFMFVHSKGRPKSFNPLRVRCQHAGKGRVGTTQWKGDVLAGDSLKRMTSAGKRIGETKNLGNIWNYVVGRDGIKGHPAVFPLQLAIDHILSWTNPGDLVVDPLAGSGTTMEACIVAGRDGIAFEIHQPYVEIARRRIAAAGPGPLWKQAE